MPEVVFLHMFSKKNRDRWMEESDSFLFPQKELGELLKTCCYGDNLATVHLACEIHIKFGSNQGGKQTSLICWCYLLTEILS